MILLHTPGHGFLSNEVPVVIRGGKLALPDNAVAVKDGPSMNLAVYW